MLAYRAGPYHRPTLSLPPHRKTVLAASPTDAQLSIVFVVTLLAVSCSRKKGLGEVIFLKRD